MKLKRDELPVIFLHAGEFYISKKTEVISTVLGSCISVILFSRKSSTCGITHSQLPSCTHEPSFCKKCQEAFRFVDCSIIKLIQKMEENGVEVSDIEAKVFGGAGMINKKSVKDNVGHQNVEMAMSILEKEGIKVIAQDTLGVKGRKLFLFTDTKEVLIKKLNGIKNQ